MSLNSTIDRVTDRIRERSLATRGRYLAQIGAAVLAYNLLILQKSQKSAEFPVEPMRIPEEVPS